MMDILDPRHGTEAGFEQHVRDGGDPCEACHHGKLIAARRRWKRKTQGFVFTMPAGLAHQRVQRWLLSGATQKDISRHTGLESSVVHRLAHGTANQTIYARTWHSVMSAPPIPLTNLGATRRVRALTALGYSAPAIARETGIHKDTIEDIRAREGALQVRVREAIAEAYARLEMRFPTGESQQDRAGITRAQNMARRNGWPPPMAFDHIDDATENPSNWEYVPANRAEVLADLDHRMAGISEACRALDLRRDSLEKWCQRNGLAELFIRMADRERAMREAG